VNVNTEKGIFMETSLAIGIVGLGRLGRRHAENLATKVPGARLVAAASVVAEEREWAKARLGVSAYPDLETLLKDPAVEAVWLVTPTSLHAGQATEVLRAGKHLFCEKPLSLDAEPCDAVIDLAGRRPDLVAMVGFMRRFDTGYAEAKRIVAANELGKVFEIQCESHDPIDPEGFFVRFAPTSGGIFLDCCIHDIDLVLWMLEGVRPLRVKASGTCLLYPALAECGDVDTAAALLEFDNGALATFHVSRTSHRGYEASMAIHGETGAVEVGRGLSNLPLRREEGGGVRTQGQPDFFARFQEAFLLEAGVFVETVKAGRPSPLTLASAREATRIAVAMRRALQTGQTVEL
jgi:myo-inositol 2-dehydrogenase / D-chiro-inositol 1-dehydrogenase